MSLTPEPPVAGGSDEPPSPPAPTRRRRWRWIFPVVLLLLIVWGALAGLRMWSVYEHTQDGLATMSGVRATGTRDLATFIESMDSSTSSPAARIPTRLHSAADDFATANDQVSSPLLAPLRILPVVGRQVRSVDALTAAAATTADRVGNSFTTLSKVTADPGTTPEQRLASAERTQVVLTHLQQQLKELDFGPSEGLVAPLADARNRFTDEYDRTMDTLDRAVVSVTGVNKFLNGPTSYLIAASNNAEMRAGSGMYLQMGTLTVQNGRFQLSDFISVEGQMLAQPGATVDPDIQNLWSWLQPNQEWRNLNVSPRFDQSARMASEMWAASGRGRVDGVIAIDLLGLQRLLRLTGPVQVTDQNGAAKTLSADNVLPTLLLDQYLQFKGVNTTRREELGRVGTAVFEAFNDRPVPADKLLRTLQQSGHGRNLMLWSSDPVEQAVRDALGASGALPQDSLLLALLNRGGNKLDQFVGVDADLTAVTQDANRKVSVKVTITNNTKPGLPLYVAGPYPGTNYKNGEYVGIVSLTVPKGAGNATTTGSDLFLTGDDGPTRVLTTKVDLPIGRSTEVTFSFDLPTSWKQVQVLPSARIPRISWTAGDKQWKDDSPRTIQLGEIG